MTESTAEFLRAFNYRFALRIIESRYLQVFLTIKWYPFYLLLLALFLLLFVLVAIFRTVFLLLFLVFVILFVLLFLLLALQRST
jgi:hypothetical protein